MLGLERVGVDDSFFDLGGDSLSAMRVIAAINTGLDAGLRCAPCSTRPRWPSWRPVSVRMRVGCEPLVAGERPAVVPLSFAQSRLWFLDQLQGPSPVYNMAVALRLGGRLDADALGAALADVVARHESLRTLFAAPEGIPRQLVMPAERADFGWQVVDATGWPADRLDEAIGAAARHAFRPGRPRFRCGHGFSASPRTNTCWWRWCTTSPPTAGRWPRWSRDLGVAYASRCAGRAPRWAPLPVQYVDYTLWQRAQFGDLDDSDSPIAAQLGYWEDALTGMPERLQLPTDRPYPPVADQRGANVTVDWPAEVQQRVREVAREHNATSFMVIQAALAVLLSSSVRVPMWQWVPIAGRGDPALDELVGFFVNTLVLRVDLAGDPTVAELLAGCGGAAWRPMSIKTCRSRCSLSGSTPPEADPSPAGPGVAGLAKLGGQQQ